MPSRMDVMVERLTAGLKESDRSLLERFGQEYNELNDANIEDALYAERLHSIIEGQPQGLRQTIWDILYLDDADNLNFARPDHMQYVGNTLLRLSPTTIIDIATEIDPEADAETRASEDYIRATAIATPENIRLAAQASPLHYLANREYITPQFDVDLTRLTPDQLGWAIEEIPSVTSLDEIMPYIDALPNRDGIIAQIGSQHSYQTLSATRNGTITDKPYFSQLLDGAVSAIEPNSLLQNIANFGMTPVILDRILARPDAQESLLAQASASPLMVWKTYNNIADAPFAADMARAAAARSAGYLNDVPSRLAGTPLLEELRGITRTALPLIYMADLTERAEADPSSVPSLTADIAAVTPRVRDDMYETSNGFNNLAWSLNQLHNYPANIRYGMLRDFQSADYFNLITNARPELYTSTYNHLYRSFNESLQQEGKTFTQFLSEDPNRQSLLNSFIEGLSNYGQFPSFLRNIGNDGTQALADTIFDMVETDQEAVVSAANFLRALPADSPILPSIEARILQGYADAQTDSERLSFGLLANLYSTQSGHTPTADNAEAFNRLQQDDRFHLPNFDQTNVLGTADQPGLIDAQGRHFQMHLFYNDEDGVTTYNYFRQQMRTQGFQATEHAAEGYVHLQKTQNGRTIHIFASIPSEGQENTANPDAVTNMQEQIAEMGGTVTYLAHRGHSYHVEDTIPYVTDQTQIVFLGACGGNTYVAGTLQRSPDAAIIATSGEGTKFVNEPIMADINRRILTGDVVDWTQVGDRIDSIRDERARFYMAPNDNMAAVILSRLQSGSSQAEGARMQQGAQPSRGGTAPVSPPIIAPQSPPPPSTALSGLFNGQAETDSTAPTPAPTSTPTADPVSEGQVMRPPATGTAAGLGGM